MDVQNRIRELRRASGLKRRELAADLGVEPVQMKRWERGEAEIDPFTARRLSERYGVTVPFVLGQVR